MFGFRPRQSRVSADQVRQLLELAHRTNRSGVTKTRFNEETGLSGYLGSAITFLQAGSTVAGRDMPHFKRGDRLSWPAHLHFPDSPQCVNVTPVGNSLEFRYTDQGICPYQFVPITRDRDVIQRIETAILFWYRDFGLPEALMEKPKPSRPTFATSMDAVRAYLDRYPDDAFLQDVVSAEGGLAVVIDHRESDDDIVDLFEAVLNTGDLKAKFVDGSDCPDLAITYRGHTTLVRYSRGYADRDTTMLSLSAVLAADFEVRHCKTKGGYDEATFIALPHTDWRNLEEQYGDKVARAFGSLTPGVAIFG